MDAPPTHEQMSHPKTQMTGEIDTKGTKAKCQSGQAKSASKQSSAFTGSQVSPIFAKNSGGGG
jgi:hypothetical protein